MDRPKGDKLAWTPKDKDKRIIHLPREASKILTELQCVAGEGQVYVFVNSKGPAKGQRLKPNNMWRDFYIMGRALLVGSFNKYYQRHYNKRIPAYLCDYCF